MTTKSLAQALMPLKFLLYITLVMENLQFIHSSVRSLTPGRVHLSRPPHRVRSRLLPVPQRRNIVSLSSRLLIGVALFILLLCGCLCLMLCGYCAFYDKGKL